MQTLIPKVDICTLSENREQNIMVSRFAEYLSRHRNLAAPHRHSFYHALLFTEGGGRHTIDFHHFDVVPYQIYFMKPGQVHSWDFDGRVEGYVVNFSGEFFQSFLLKQDYLDTFSFLRGQPLDNVLNLEGETREKVLALFETLVVTNETPSEHRDDMIRTLLLQVFMVIETGLRLSSATGLRRSSATGLRLSSATGLRRSSATGLRQGSALNHPLLHQYQKLIGENFIDLRLPGQYAEMLNISPNHLNALCKEHFGLQAGQLIRDRIVLEAKRLLVNVDLSISEIAYKLNFKDNAYFSKFFKKAAGISPEVFRRKNTR